MSNSSDDFRAKANSLVSMDIFLLSESNRFIVNVTNKNIVTKLKYK